MLEPFRQRRQHRKSPRSWCQPLLMPHHVLFGCWNPGLRAHSPGEQRVPALPPGPLCLWKREVYRESVQFGGNSTSPYHVNSEHETSTVASPAS